MININNFKFKVQNRRSKSKRQKHFQKQQLKSTADSRRRATSWPPISSTPRCQFDTETSNIKWADVAHGPRPWKHGWADGPWCSSLILCLLVVLHCSDLYYCSALYENIETNHQSTSFLCYWLWLLTTPRPNSTGVEHHFASAPPWFQENCSIVF